MYSKEEAKKLRQEFWDTFKERSKKISPDGIKPRRWMLKNTGIKGLELKFQAENGFARVMINITHKYEARRYKIYDLLKMYAVVINDIVGEDMIWDRHLTNDIGKEQSCIYFELEPITYHNRVNWEPIFDFFLDKMPKVELAIEELKEILQEKIKSDWEA